MVQEVLEPENPEEEPETGEETPEPTAEAEETTTAAAPKPPANELKVVIVMKAENILLGVQAPDCDPVYTTMKGTLAKALKKVPSLVAEAKQKWESTPRYPKANLPEPPPAPAQTRTTTTTKPAKSTVQQTMF